jgi:hypothetical protein
VIVMMRVVRPILIAVLYMGRLACWTVAMQSAVAVLYATGGQEGSFLDQLPLSHEEQKIIAKIISTIGSKNEILLLLEKRSLERKGKEIEHVHPLRFLSVIFTDRELKAYFRSIRKSHFKWGHLLDGLSRRLEEEADRDNLLRYLPAFSQLLEVNLDVLRVLAHNRDWEAFVTYLL